MGFIYILYQRYLCFIDNKTNVCINARYVLTIP